MPSPLRALPNPSFPAAGEEPYPQGRLRVVAWPDPVIDVLGHDPRSWYVEQFWLGVVGPTSAWLMRRLVAALDSAPDGYDADLEDLARALGVGGLSGRNSPCERAIKRCEIFGLARRLGHAELAVRRRIPPMPRRYLVRLPSSLQELHASWQEAQRRGGVLPQVRGRARRLALSLVEIGHDREATEVQLHRWGVHPALAFEAAQWALDVRASAAVPVTARSPIVNAAFTARP